MEKLETGAAALGLILSPTQLASFKCYYSELVEWNKKTNLTAITDFEEVQVKHFLDSLTIAFITAFNKPLNVIDIGAGAGFPGLPLKIAFPSIRLTLLEATGKKARFLKHIVDTLGLEEVSVINGRAEEIAHQAPYRETYDLTTARAVAALPALVEICLPFCKTGGRFIALKKGDIREELTQARMAIAIMGGKLSKTTRVELEDLNDDRRLVLIEKVKATPPQYPRRPGIPEKNPILS